MELFDLYNADRKPIERTMIRGQSQPENTFRLVVHCCVFNSDGHMLIQRRQDFKEGWSGMWDITCGGSAVAGENSQKAIEREIFEELGIKNDFSDVRPILTIHFDKGFDDIYTVNRDIDVNDLTLQKEEVAEVKWATEEEILNMIKDGIFIPYHEHLIGLLFFMRNKRGAFKND
ncbi:MAG: NUDIX domain-containing protein [Ruminiclostridium sp.]|nr:NUDIX domain-containing protein [Ruminiclostridium sp.]